MVETIPNCFYRISTKALVRDDTKTKILLLKEDNNKWDLPWWWLDFGNTPQQDIKRELQEETWLETIRIADRPSYFTTMEKFEKWFWIANIIYEAKLKDLNFTKSNECQTLWFFTKKEALKLDLFPNVKALLDQLDI